MEKRLLQTANLYLKDLETIRDAQEKRAYELEKYRNCFLRGKTFAKGKTYYSVRKKGGSRHKYLGSDNNDEVRNIKELRYVDDYLERIDNNIGLVKTLINEIQMTGYDSINETLPKVYSNPHIGSVTFRNNKRLWKERAEALKSRYEIYKPHELNKRTNDGNFVRSKSEAMIYNYLLSVDAAFIYELPTKIDGKLLVPDFTILSDIDTSSEIIIEHQGMMDSEFYRNRFAEKVYHYLRAGFVQGINIFFTFDDLNGGFDIIPIEDIVRNSVIGE